MTQRTNQERIDSGSDLFHPYMCTDGADSQAPQDIITDLLHYLHSKGIDCAEVLSTASDNFLNEIEETSL